MTPELTQLTHPMGEQARKHRISISNWLGVGFQQPQQVDNPPTVHGQAVCLAMRTARSDRGPTRTFLSSASANSSPQLEAVVEPSPLRAPERCIDELRS